MKNSFLKIPNLPDSKLTLAAVGNYPEIISALKNEGIRTVSFCNRNLSEETAMHQDMLMCHTEENRIFLDPHQDKSILEKEGFTVCFSDRLQKNYPDDVKLNCAVSEGFFICNKKCIDKSLHDALISSGKTPVYVNQGYSKCSVCFVSSNAVITEDTSIKTALDDMGVDVLLISKGDIYLSENHYGFFGGSTGKLDKNTLAVTGELKYHKDGNDIRSFCKRYGVAIIELTKGKIIDIGGIIPLKS